MARIEDILAERGIRPSADGIVLPAGFYEIGTAEVQGEGLRIRAEESGTVTFEGSLQVRGSVTFEGIIFSPALDEDTCPRMDIAQGSRIDIVDCQFIGGEQAAITMQAGRVDIRGSRFESIRGEDTALRASGKDAHLSLERCVMDGCVQPVVGQDGATVEVTDCELVGSAEKKPQVVMRTGAQVTLSGCRLNDGLNSAVWVKEKGQASLTGCTLSGFHKAAAIEARDAGSKVVVSGTAISDGRQSIYGLDGATVEATECELAGSAENSPQVVMKTGAQVTLSGCRLRDGLNSAVWVFERGQASLKGCTISGFHKLAAISAQDAGSKVVVSGTTIGDGHQPIYGQDGATVAVTDCELVGSAENYSQVGVKTGAQVTLSGCRLRDGLSHAVWVKEKGQASLKGCTLSGFHKAAAIEARDAGSKVVVSGTAISDGRQSIYGLDGATVEATECELAGSAENSPQVVMKTGAQVTLSGCRLRDGLNSAVWVFERGQASLKGCTISGFHKSAAIWVQDAGSKVVVSGTTIRDGHQPIYGQDGATVAVTDCELVGSAENYSQVVMTSGAQVTLSGCHLRDGLSHAVWVKEKGQASLTGCTISGFHKGMAIWVQDAGSRLVVSGTTIRDGLRPIVGQDGATVEVKDCELVGSAETYPQVTMISGAQVTLSGCRLRDGLSNAVWVKEKGQASLTGCTISGFHKDSAIDARDAGSKLVVSGTTIRDGKRPILGQDGATVEVKDCELVGSAETYPQVTMISGAQVTLSGCRLRDGLSNAVWVKEKGKANLTNCTISGFRRAAAFDAHGFGSEISACSTSFYNVDCIQSSDIGGWVWIY
ncbi:right-handed parallel beta-helix repeat-containing protein [Novacetimonas maltaceti]|uniref:right-handed parallel beta-helix repeat-containing protein n=3 Tax=Novacetimonas maltaceti TaxID=1203393 RepID=UPI00142D5CB7|nr:right-handed parallel beta-helix repeat-containing protein [Novacetimonas maltaceti]